ncbi:MAG: AI-2E family transporter [Myxococcota bacterium]
MANGIGNLLHNKRRQQLVLLGLLSCLIGLAVLMIRSALLPFVLAILLAYVVNPLVNRLTQLQLGKHLLPRWAAIACVYLLIATLMFLLSAFFLPRFYREVLDLARNATYAIQTVDETRIAQWVHDLQEFLQQRGLPIQLTATAQQGATELSQGKNPLFFIDLEQMVHSGLHQLLDSIRQEAMSLVAWVQHLIAQVAGFIFKSFLVLVISGFLLADLKRIRQFLLNLVPPQDQQRFSRFLHQLDRGLSGVVRGQLMICLVNGVLTLIGLLLLGVPFAVVLATLAGVLSLVPIFGSIISTVPIAVVALTQSVLLSVLAVLWIVVIHALEANFLNPKIMGHAAKIHPVLVILALVVGEHFYGLMGALLAVPVASILKTAFVVLLAWIKGLTAGAAEPSQTQTTS